jgi:hypothetical protein
MVHSFARPVSDREPVVDMAKTQQDNTELYSQAGLTTLAEDGPRVIAAKDFRPMLTDDEYGLFRRFFDGQQLELKDCTVPVPEQAAEEIRTALQLKLNNKEVFNSIVLWTTANRGELLVVGSVNFGPYVRYFPIVQWRTFVDTSTSTDGYTSIEELREERRKRDREDFIRREAVARKERRIDVATALVSFLFLVLTLVGFVSLTPAEVVIGGMFSFILMMVGILTDWTEDGGPLKWAFWLAAGNVVLIIITMFAMIGTGHIS